MIINQLAMAVLAVNGIKVVVNTRTGKKETEYNFKNIPVNIMCSSGFLGCDKAKNLQDTAEYVDKILTLRANKLVIYGKKDKKILEQLDTMGINYKF